MAARQQPRQRVVVYERGALQRALMIDSERSDGRRVLHLPAQGVVVGTKRCLAQGLDAGVTCVAVSGTFSATSLMKEPSHATQRQHLLNYKKFITFFF